jgi:hypothetical protein
MRRVIVLVVLALVATMVGCGRDEAPSDDARSATPEQPGPVSTEVPRAESSVVSEGLALRIDEVPAGLRRYDVGDDAIGFHAARDRRRSFEIRNIAAAAPTDLGAIIDEAVRNSELGQYSGVEEVASEDFAGPHGPAAWRLYRHQLFDAAGSSAWMFSVHPDGRKVLVIRIWCEGEEDPSILRNSALQLLSSLQAL